MKTIVGVGALLVSTGYAQEDWRAKYPLCLDYATVGTGLCGAQPSPTQVVAVPSLLVPEKKPAKSKVDEFLENYGKPPREFVEFYVNPTAENAQKWSDKYNELIDKTKTVAAVWQGVSSSSTAVVAPTQDLVRAVPLAPEGAESVPAAGIPDLSARSDIGQLGAVGAGLQATYYFSAHCPYCAQMTESLVQLSSEMAGKLTLTCVDVTPDTPRPENIVGRLGCQWRLPEVGEVEAKGINQTPTLFYKQAGGAEKKLSGAVPLADLKVYLKGN